MQLPYADLALAMLQVGVEDLCEGQEVNVDCTAPVSAIRPVPGAFDQQKEILIDNLKRKVLPWLLLCSTAIVAGLLYYRHWYSAS